MACSGSKSGCWSISSVSQKRNVRIQPEIYSFTQCSWQQSGKLLPSLEEVFTLVPPFKKKLCVQEVIEKEKLLQRLIEICICQRICSGSI